MAFSVTLGLNVSGDIPVALNNGITETGSGLTQIDESVADSETDKQMLIAIDVSAVVLFYIVSTFAVTLETNSGGSPIDTLVLVADEPYCWHASSLDTFLLGTDVTSFFFTNASGSSADIKGVVVQDLTP